MYIHAHMITGIMTMLGPTWTIASTRQAKVMAPAKGTPATSMPMPISADCRRATPITPCETLRMVEPAISMKCRPRASATRPARSLTVVVSLSE